MTLESFRWLAGLVAAHPDRKVVGRTRLQKTVWLLQRKKFPTDYSYLLHFYGPYSEDLNSEVKLARQLGLLKEEVVERSDRDYYIYRAEPNTEIQQVQRFQKWIDVIRDTDDVPLELAATYDAFREMGYDHQDALERMRRKKAGKCTDTNERAALELLSKLELPTK